MGFIKYKKKYNQFSSARGMSEIFEWNAAGLCDKPVTVSQWEIIATSLFEYFENFNSIIFVDFTYKMEP